MTVALSTRWSGASAEKIIAVARDLDVRAFAFDAPPTRPQALRRELKSSGIDAAAVTVDGVTASDENTSRFAERLETAIAAASALRAGAVVVEGGGGDEREVAVERIVRVLHGGVMAGVPLAVLNGGVLGFEELEWVLDDLPRLSFWFDPARVGEGGDLAAWTERYAARCAGCVARGRHPEDLGLPWSTLAASLPRRLVWMFDPNEDLSRSDVADGLRYLRSLAAAR